MSRRVVVPSVFAIGCGSFLSSIDGPADRPTMHLEGITMSHAGTMDLGRKAQSRPGGTRLPAVTLALAAIVATIAVAWFVTKPGVLSGAATTPAADRSFDQIEAQRGAVALSADRSAYLNSIVDGAHATPFAATMPNDLSVRRGYPVFAAVIAQPDNLSARRGYAVEIPSAPTLPDNLSARRGYAVEAQPAAIALSAGRNAYLNSILDGAHATPFVATMPNDLSARRGYPAVAAATASTDLSVWHGYWVETPSVATLPDNVSVRRGYPAVVAAVALPDNLSARRGYAGVAATMPVAMSVWHGYWSQTAAALPDNLSARRGYSVEIQSPAFSATSGTFHPGKAADDRIFVPVVRDRIGGP
jgi:hypothetical protein